MTVSTNAAAEFICERSGWAITQLSLQKILYIAHMVHMGRGHGPLVPGHFEAWDYGPVHPVLYQKVKGFGAKPIPNVFWTKTAPDGVDLATLTEACEQLLPLSLRRTAILSCRLLNNIYLLSNDRGLLTPQLLDCFERGRLVRLTFELAQLLLLQMLTDQKSVFFSCQSKPNY